MSRNGSANVTAAGGSQTCNDVVEWHRRYHEYQTTWRTVRLTCWRCGNDHDRKVRGYFRTKRPRLCPDCIAGRTRSTTRAWRQRQSAMRLCAQAERACDCGQPIPGGRKDRRHCSPACRQKAYRERKAA